MKRTNPSLIWGLLLILAGVILLAQNYGIINLGSLWAAVWMILFGVAGVAFIWFFLGNQEHWWALIPGFSLLGLATLLAMDLFLGSWADDLGAPIFLASIGLGFVAVYLVRREQWWALIPGGVLASIAAMVFLESAFPGREWVMVMFMGMAATFALIALIPVEGGRNTWAFIPAGVLFAIGLFIFTPVLNAFAILGPLALILGGGYLLYRTVLSR